MPLLLQLDVLGCSVNYFLTVGCSVKLFEKRWIETLRNAPQRRQSDILQYIKKAIKQTVLTQTVMVDPSLKAYKTSILEEVYIYERDKL